MTAVSVSGSAVTRTCLALGDNSKATRTKKNGADGGGRTHTSVKTLDFESSASANSATSASFKTTCKGHEIKFVICNLPLDPAGAFVFQTSEQYLQEMADCKGFIAQMTYALDLRSAFLPHSTARHPCEDKHPVSLSMRMKWSCAHPNGACLSNRSRR